VTQHQHEAGHIRTYVIDLFAKAAFEVGPKRLKAAIVISALGSHAGLIPFGIVPYTHKI
jgi:hypothetical protein